jgi:hypothetical protein
MRNVKLMKFENGFRLYDEENPEDKFFILDEEEFKIGDEFRVGPNGYFEYVGNRIEESVS